MRPRTISGILAGVAVAAWLAGCGETAAEPTRTPVPAEPAAPAAAASVPAAAATASPAEVYRWKAPAGSDGHVAAKGDGWNTLILVPAGVLHGGRAYLAELRYRIVVAPPYPGTPFPGTFHLFARSKSLGQERDAWVNFIGDPGDSGTARLPMHLPSAEDWTFTVGCKGAGELAVSSLVIREGDGFASVPATATVEAAPARPDVTPVATGCPAVTIAPPADGTGLVISTAEFGLTADGPDAPVSNEVAAANALGLHRALVACSTRKASRLVIPTGTYRFYPKDPLQIGDQQDLTIDGQGSLLVFAKLMRGVSALNLHQCKRVALRDLRIDWDWRANPIASIAVVDAVADDRRSCTMRFPDLDAEVTERLKSVEWTHISPMDGSAVRLTPKIVSREHSGGNLMQVAFTTPQPLVAGSTYQVRHLYYEMGAFKMNDCSNVLFEQVTIHSMPGMGWVMRGDLDHIGLRRCRIAPPEGSTRPMSTSADGLHILESQGGILIEDCEFTRTGDDCINIHDNCAQGVRQTAPNALTLVGNQRYKMKVTAGDRLELFRPDYAPIGWSGTVAKVAFTDKDTQVEFAEPLPEQVSPLSIVFNRRYGTCDVRIVNSRFTTGRVLLSARRVTVEGCTFEHTAANAIQLHTEIVGSLWAEGSGAADVVIRGNTFSDTNRILKFGGPAIHGQPVLPAGRTTFPLFSGILVENNRFSGNHGPILSLAACERVVVRGNSILDAAPVPGATVLAGCILAESGRDLRLGGNTWTAPAATAVVYDPAVVSGLVTAGNRIAKP